MDLNLSKFETKTASEDGFELAILDANGDESGLFVRIRGQDSAQYQALKTKFDRKRLTKISKIGREKAMPSILDEGVDQDMDITIACVMAWSYKDKDGVLATDPVTYNGQPMDDPDTLEDFFTEAPIVYEQIRVAIHTRANFTKASA